MRHLRKSKKLGRRGAHLDAMLASMVCSLVKHGRVRTTLPKARMARGLAERLVTKARTKTLAMRRHLISILAREDAVQDLLEKVAPRFAGRPGGYTRIVKLGRRSSDSSEMAILEWVVQAAAPETVTDKPAEKKA